jgi:site-specific DNA-methyltransferase (adenine-specific)
MPPRTDYSAEAGRWPANVCLDEDAAAVLDEQTGDVSHNPPAVWKSVTTRAGEFLSGIENEVGSVRGGFGDRGGPSRFFYTAKASRADRTSGGFANNTHPTVKPTDLMRWLVRMVTPPGGLVLDPFSGSGTTLVAARAEGVRAVGIEREDEYARIIADRLAQLSLFSQAG